jgi:aminoglycoside phosphotransferase (APT) family kinase protein
MLFPADEALALRDRALPGLGPLLDEDRLGGWLGERTGTAVRLHTRYLRYKQGTSCVLSGHLETASGASPCLVSAYATEDLAKLAKTLERAPGGSVLAVDLARGLLATTPGADRDLPALARLDDDGRRRRLLRALLPDRRGLREARLSTLRHKPHRRWVGLVEPTLGPRVVMRAYRPGESRAAVAAIDACSHGPAATPALIGADTRYGVAAVEFVAGDVLALRAATACERVGDFHSAGAALGRLHGSRDLALRAAPPGADAQAVRAAATQLTVLLPQEAQDVRRLASALATRLLAMPQVRVPIHGDFSADQVVVDEAGGATLIDLDSARLGDPACDLACATAAITRDVVLGRIADATGRAWLRALREGYACVADLPDEERLAAHEAAHLFRRAVEPFRLRLAPDWPDAAHDLVARARRTLTDHSLADGVR